MSQNFARELSHRVAVDKRYKHEAGRGGSRRKRRGMDTRLYVPTSQLKCHCPKVY